MVKTADRDLITKNGCCSSKDALDLSRQAHRSRMSDGKKRFKRLEKVCVVQDRRPAKNGVQPRFAQGSQ
jgi:hypothetical protein